MDYKYGNKKQWRRWVWNRLQERTQRQGEGLVLFLAGESAHDIWLARRKGFSPRNMLAVEHDGPTRDKLRAKGVLTIDGDLCDVLAAWPKDRPVTAVLADFCSGFEERYAKSFLAVQTDNPSFAHTAFALNMLRGRDKSTNWVRSWLVEKGFDEKHRGYQFYLAVMVSLVVGEARLNGYDEEQAQQILDRRFPVVCDMTRPGFYSYQSAAGSQVFDCCVWKNFIGDLAAGSPRIQALQQRQAKLSPDLDGLSQRRRIAAVLAHHTRRQLEISA